MATVHVSTWSQFLDAISYSENIVILPENAEWEIDEPYGTIGIYCAEIQGNGTKIKNLIHRVSDYFSQDVFQINDFCHIYDLYLENIECYQDYDYGHCSIFSDSSTNLQRNSAIHSDIRFERCSVYGRMYASDRCDTISIIHARNTASAIKAVYCAARVEMPSGGVITHDETGYGQITVEGCRFEITTPSTTSPGNLSGRYFPFADSGQASSGQIPTKIKSCEVILHAPNVEYLEIYKPQEDYPTKYTWNNYSQLSNCVFRGETKSNCTISRPQKQGTSGSGIRASVFEDNLGTIDQTIPIYRQVSADESTMKSYQNLYDATHTQYSAYYDFFLGDAETEWHTGDISVNNGFPYIPKMIDLPRIELHPVPQNPYITVFDITSTQNELNNTDKNGDVILTPTSCEVTEELNGAWTFTMTHPIDADGKWEHIKLRNIVKINGQYFTIMNTVISFANNSGSIQCSGEHIFYQQNDSWIFPGDMLTGASGQAFINAMDARTESYSTELASLVYDFTGSSDITTDSIITKDVGDGCTPIDALLGSGGLIDQSDTGSAELYRDNFYYSINHRMENARDNAFDIRIGRDLQGITQNFDTTNFVSYFRAYADFGWWAIAWKLTSFLARRFPHHIIRSKNFDIEAGDNCWDELINQGHAFFRRNAKPIIGWDIDLEDVRNNADFSMMSSERLKVGDSGNVYDVRLGGNLTVKISGTVFDAVRNKMKRIMIGDQAHFSAPAASTISIEPETIGGDIWIQDADGAFILDADGKKIIQEVRYDG